ncbi:hypothetical protein Dsin_019029 [Dipteronia sinensis]|uniref:CCHC-type domain-containing protein n=1 Tax=Dipteronia sinensis TaxID=43782 RepID=A0AAE0A7W0_9ROSI|nr:hypothetical protein Dsin_019029 [Dipteronia sinensis]
MKPSKDIKKYKGKRGFRGKKTYKTYKRKDNASCPKQQHFKKSTKRASRQRNIRCFKCGKQGHYANNCQELKNKIQSLDIDDHIKDRLIQVLCDESDTDIEISSLDNEILILGDSDTTEKTSSDDPSEETPETQLCICKEINVLDQHDYSLIISMIDIIEDPTLKAGHTRQLQKKFR